MLEQELTDFGTSLDTKQPPPTPKLLQLTIYKLSEYNEPDYPSTITKCWIPLLQMIEVYTFSSKFATSVRYLLNQKHITGWKKVRGDGNCYFTAVTLKFIENLHKPYRDTKGLLAFYTLLKSLSQITFPDANYKHAYTQMRARIKSSIHRKNIDNDHVQVYIDILALIQDKYFAEICVRISRLVTYKSFMDRFSTGELSFFMSKPEDEYIKDILTMGIEAEDLTLLILPAGLGAQVVQFNIFDNNVYEQVIPEVEPYEDQILIVRRSGHYDLLYSRKEQELDQYCFYNKTYYFGT